MSTAPRSLAPLDAASGAVARWIGEAANLAARRLAGDGTSGLAVARSLGIAGFLERAGVGGFSRPPGETLAARLRDTLLLEAAVELSGAFETAGVRHAFIKGGGLLGRIYAPGDRDQVDLDVLIAPADVCRAFRVLLRLGYAVPDEARRDAPPAMRRGRSFVRRGSSDLDEAIVDANWAVAPVNRLLTYADRDALDPVWSALDHAGPVPAPAPGHHLALVVHHLVYHDLLHARGLMDAALLAARMTEGDRPMLADLAARLGVRRAVEAVQGILAAGIGQGHVSPRPGSWRDRQLQSALDPAALFASSAAAPARAHLEITTARIRTRLIAVDRVRDMLGLVRDVVWPPAAYLAWRWPGARTAGGARWMHFRRVLGKAVG